MGNLVLAQEQVVPEPVVKVFARFGTRGGSGWLFDAACDTVARGAVVRFLMPLPDGQVVLATGRIADVQTNRRIVILQETPWTGRMVLTFRAQGQQCLIRLGVTVSDECIAWLGRSAGGQPSESDPETEDRGVRVGLLVSLSGTAGLLGRASQNAAQLAIEELNQDGGVCGLPVSLHIGDESTSPLVALREFNRLTETVGCDVVVAMMSSASMALVRPVARARRTLLLYTPAAESGPFSEHIVHFGERPYDQLAYSIPLLMKTTGGRGWFLVGNRYSWPETVLRVGKNVIEQTGGKLLGARFLPMGQSCFDEVLEAVEASGADHLISAMVGADAVAFERSFFARGLREKVRTIATLFDDVVREHVGDDAAAGIWSPLDYFFACDHADGGALAKRWQSRFGAVSPPLSSTAKSVYDAVHAYGQSAHLARSITPDDVARAMWTLQPPTSPLLIRSAGRSYPTSIAEAVRGGFALRETPSSLGR